MRKLVDDNKSYADQAAASIRNSVETTDIVLLVMLLMRRRRRRAAGYCCSRAVTMPMANVLQVVDVMRTGDLTQRLQLNRADEFGTLEAGFNRMTDELTALVGQAQKSAVQVTTSVTEIAATSTRAAGHRERDRRDHDRDRRDLARDLRDLARPRCAP